MLVYQRVLKSNVIATRARRQLLTHVRLLRTMAVSRPETGVMTPQNGIPQTITLQPYKQWLKISHFLWSSWWHIHTYMFDHVCCNEIQYNWIHTVSTQNAEFLVLQVPVCIHDLESHKPLLKKFIPKGCAAAYWTDIFGPGMLTTDTHLKTCLENMFSKHASLWFIMIYIIYYGLLCKPFWKTLATKKTALFRKYFSRATNLISIVQYPSISYITQMHTLSVCGLKQSFNLRAFCWRRKQRFLLVNQ